MVRQITLEKLQQTEPLEPLEIGQIRHSPGPFRITFLVCDLDLGEDLLRGKFGQIKVYILEGQKMKWVYQESSFVFDSTVLKGV